MITNIKNHITIIRMLQMINNNEDERELVTYHEPQDLCHMENAESVTPQTPHLVRLNAGTLAVIRQDNGFWANYIHLF